MARVKKKSYENLTAGNIQRVLEALGQDSPITKKEACEMLNIAYNTTRLTRILEDFEEQQAYVKKRKQQNRGRPASKAEIQDAVLSYLQGDNISDISKSMYRSAAFVKSLLERIGVPQRPASLDERVQNAYLPEECVAEDFDVSEKVWSAAYHAPAVIEKRLEDKKYMNLYGCPCYSIYIFEKVDSSDSFYSNTDVGGFYAYSPAYDLGKLLHLQEHGVKLERI